ncbi:hypothetical protein AVEN_236277-1 [Araneus ventricosus]|uniref:Uncharacterized protein n=1 Tax=Araneus ventricosus TaxID=182803 RepID=A0A4Y2V375_ARAVE|nr:hypothetical protein AVEN_173635-1 [Araneus ventricosus]GBO19713.1 hypothetical protein AVEN_236277-1 [Araneus ventricosus]
MIGPLLTHGNHYFQTQSATALGLRADTLSKALQSKSLICLTVKELVNTTKECLHEFRSEDFFEKLWIYVNDICEAKSFTSPKLPRSRKVSSEIGGSSFSMSQGVKSFYET